MLSTGTGTLQQQQQSERAVESEKKVSPAEHEVVGCRFGLAACACLLPARTISAERRILAGYVTAPTTLGCSTFAPALAACGAITRARPNPHKCTTHQTGGKHGSNTTTTAADDPE